MNNDNLVTALSVQIQISIALIGMVRELSIEPILLAKRWGIILEKAQKNIQATAQREIRTMLHPLLSRQFRTNNRNRFYCHLAHPVFSDKIFASAICRRGNRCAQVYDTDFGCATVFPMASRSETHGTLLLLFSRDGVLPACIYNNSKEMVQGKLY